MGESDSGKRGMAKKKKKIVMNGRLVDPLTAAAASVVNGKERSKTRRTSPHLSGTGKRRRTQLIT